MYTTHHNRLAKLAILLAFAGTAALLSGCATKQKGPKPGELVHEIDTAISQLEADYGKIRKAAPELRSALLEGPKADFDLAEKAEDAIRTSVSESEDAVALVESKVLELEEMEGAEGYKEYAKLEKKAQGKRKKAWAQVKVWWDDYDSALQSARSLREAGNYFSAKLPGEYQKATDLVQAQDWEAGKEALARVSRQLRTEADALSEALAELKIESGGVLTQAVSLFEDMFRLSIEFCDAGIANDTTRQTEISKDIEAGAKRLEALAINPDTVGAEIRTQLERRGADFDFTKTESLLSEAKKLEEQAQSAKPKEKTKEK